jgi:arylsulfatase A-like enzyme
LSIGNRKNKTMKKSILTIISCVLVATLFGQDVVKKDSTNQRPNIVLLLADDTALMDFGAYGGEASTPNIDRLAKRGMMFTNYHASPMCAPSRAMLITGSDSHLTGVPNLPIFLPPEYISQPGYEGVLNNKVQTIATRLKNNGYRTYMTGKWHLGHTETTLPSKRGFDRTFILDASGADNWEHKPYLATQDAKPPWFQDGELVDLPDDFYSSKTYVDKMISFMKEEEEKEDPFFAFIAFQAIHIPVQAPKEFVEKYQGVYDEGWEKMKQRRFEKAKELEIIPADAKLGEILPKFEKWENTSAEEKKIASNDMAVNAAMLEAMDFHIGRYIKYLEENGLMENTVFIVTSDNGPEASDPSMVIGSDQWMWYNENHRDQNRLGEKGYYGFIGPQFASAAAGPNAFFKFYAGEGGLRVPLIFSGKNIPPGKSKAFSFITDMAPTILDIAGIDYDEQSSINPMTGHSLFPIIQKDTNQVYAQDEPIGMEAAGQAAIFRGDFKLVRNGKPYGDGIWRMYNLKNDPGETKDLATSNAKLFEDLKIDYKNYTTKYGVLEMPEDYETVEEITNKVKRALTPWLIGFVVLMASLFILFRRMRRKK